MSQFTLPYPPTTNNLFINLKSGGRAPSGEYKLWQKEALQSLAIQRPKPVTGLFYMRIEAFKPDRRRRDVTNLIKALEDLIKRAGLIEDDCLAMEVTALWSSEEPRKGEPVRIHLHPWPRSNRV